MDFVTSVLKRTNKCDSIWVIIDIPTKTAYFVMIKFNYPLQKLTELYIKKIVSLHGILSGIVSDRDLRFMLRLW